MAWSQEIIEHYAGIWGSHGEACTFEKGPVKDLGPAFEVRKYAPHQNRNMWTFATCGMSTPDDRDPIELHMFSPTNSLEIVELLVVTSHFHRSSAALNLWHTVNFGRPWLQGSSCTSGLISLPYLDGPRLETLDVQGSAIKCYWLIPVTSAEVKFKIQHGVDALEQAFEKVGLDYTDVLRGSVV